MYRRVRFPPPFSFLTLTNKGLMKVILEGSSEDVRNALTDRNAAYNEARAQLRVEATLEKNAFLTEEIFKLSSQLDATDRGCNENNKVIAAKNIYISSLENDIKNLKNEIIYLKGSNNSPKTSPEQDIVLEETFQKMLAETATPLKLSQFGEVTPAVMFETIFGILATGNRFLAIKEIRAVTKLGLIRTRNLVDDTLRAFGCNVNESGHPIP